MDKQELLEDLNRQLVAAMYKVTELDEAIARLRESMARDAVEHCVELSQSGPIVTEKDTSDLGAGCIHEWDTDEIGQFCIKCGTYDD